MKLFSPHNRDHVVVLLLLAGGLLLISNIESIGIAKDKMENRQTLTNHDKNAPQKLINKKLKFRNSSKPSSEDKVIAANAATATKPTGNSSRVPARPLQARRGPNDEKLSISVSNYNTNRENVTTTPSNSTNNSATEPNTNTTHLIIHIGPIKTGTTSIQCNLQVNPFLKESSYEFLGKKENICAPTRHNLIRPSNHEKKSASFMDVQEFIFRYILRGWLKQDQKQDYVNNFQQDMEYRVRSGIHSIISGEEFCGMLIAHDDRWQEFADLLNGINQDVRFKVVYRDFFDWAVSKYAYHELTYKYKKPFAKKSYHSIVDDSMRDLFSPGGDAGCHPYKMWSMFNSKLPAFRRGRAVDVFNMHGEGDVATRFICSLPDAEAACEGSKKLELKKSNPTNNDKLHADRIATAAWKSGMYFNSSAVEKRRKDVIRAINDHVNIHLNSSFLELPLECLGKHQLDELLNTSIFYGREMLGVDFDEEAMKSKFDTFVAKKKFCSVNVTEVLMDPNWQNFFKNETMMFK